MLALSLLVWIIIAIIVVISFLFTGIIGAWLAHLGHYPWWIGGLIGVVFHLPGLLALVVVDIALAVYHQAYAMQAQYNAAAPVRVGP